MEVDSGQTTDANSHQPMSTSKSLVEPNTSQTSNPDVPETSPISKSRYGRTRKPKISEDFYNIDVIFESARESKKSPRGTPQVKSPVAKSVKPQHNQSPLNKPKVNSSASLKSPKSRHFVHVTGDTVMTESTCVPTSDTSNEIQSPVNTKAVRKFFKRESIATPVLHCKEPTETENSFNVECSKQKDVDVPALTDESLTMQAVDVTKVLKIISTKSPDPLQNSSDSKGSFKPILKTYSNKRKSFQKIVVESFGLPDKPIFPLENEKSSVSNEPKRIKNLDVAAPSSESEINIVDKKLLDTPWKIASMNTDFADSEILSETICDEPQDENNVGYKMECSTENSKQNASEASSLLEIDENMNDDKIKSNKSRKGSPKKQKVCSEVFPSAIEASENLKSPDPSGQKNILKDTSPRKHKHQKTQYTAKIISKQSPPKKLIQEKETEIGKGRSPRKQKQITSELLIIATEDSKNTEIKTTVAKTLRKLSPRKQKQTSHENNPAILETPVEDPKKSQVVAKETKTIRNKSPRKQKREECSDILETHDNNKNGKDNSKTEIIQKPANSKQQTVAIESPITSPQSVDHSPRKKSQTRSTSQKRKHSLSPNKTVNLQGTVEQIFPQANENFVALTPQRKSLRLQTETTNNIGKKLSIVVSRQLPKKIKNTDKPIEAFDVINLVEESGGKKSKSALDLKIPNKIKDDEDDVSEELDEMDLESRSTKSKVVEPLIKLEKDGDVSQECVEINLIGRRSGRRSKIEANMKHSKKVENCDNSINQEVAKRSRDKKAKEEVYCVDDNKYVKDLDEMNLLDRSRMFHESSVSPRMGKRNVSYKKHFSTVTSSTASDLILEIKEEMNIEDENNSDIVEADIFDDGKQPVNECTSSTAVQEEPAKKQEEINESGKSLYDLQIKTEPEDVELGDLMWAKIGGHPYWPCVVSEDPVLKQYKSIRKYIKHLIMSYHVRFFGDKGRRSWVSSASVIRYTDKNDLNILYDKVKCKTNAVAVLQPYIVKPGALSKWKNAVSEAESLKSSNAQQRFDFFFNMFASDEEKELKSLELTSTSVEMKTPAEAPKPVDVSEKEIKQEFPESSPVRVDKRKSSKTPKLDVSGKQTKTGLLQLTATKKSVRTPKPIRTEHISRSRLKVEPLSKKPTTSKSLPPSAFEPPSNKSDTSSESRKENVKSKAAENSEKVTQSSKSALNESAVKPARKGVSSSNAKQELESHSRISLPLKKDVSKTKVRKESRENSIDEPPDTFLKNPWQAFDMAKRQLNTPLNEVNSECSLSDTDSHSKSSTNTPIPSTYKDQIARQRRNNLFRGIPRHRVCQVCKKPGEILKCKGPCNGLFHYECSGTSASDSCALIIKKEASAESESSSDKNEELKENKKAENNLPNGVPDTNHLKNVGEYMSEGSKIKKAKSEFQGNEMKPADVPLTNGDEKHNNLEDKTKEEKIPNDSKSVADAGNASNKVEIIHIDCDDSDFEHSLTPKVRLTPGTDFASLSLAEQIDMKMKEIMQKFEKNTRYADSTTDYTSSEESSSNILPPAPKPKIAQKKKQLKIKHVTADCVSFVNNSSSDDLIGEGTSADASQEINSSSCSQGVSSTANSEIVEPCPMENGKGNIPKNKEQTAEELHVTGDTTADCEASSDLHSIKEFKCGYCIAEIEPPCFVCGKEVSSKNVSFRQKCSLHMCGKFYHPECLKMWPQTQWSLISTAKHKNSNKWLDTFVCPVHVCHTCASDNPHAAISRCTSDKVVKCLRCPATYHTTNYCVPAGALILSTSQIVCPRHLGQKVIKKGKVVKYARTINTPWCFICSKGGDLICCETCPTSVHSDCLQINLLEDGTFICEDCETGRFPLYDEIVWVKLGAYRWWPAVILFPNEIPDNVKNIPHSKGEFVVKFFGTHDHYWVHRGRVFLFQEGDKGHCSPTRKRVDALFKKSIEEAAAAHHFKKVFKMNKEAEIRTGMKPPPYIRVKVNKPVGNVRLFDGNISNTTSCECDPNQSNPCGPDSDCLNRLLLTECDPNICPAKDKCNNQRFEKRQYSPLVPFKTPARGWGLKPLAPVRKGDFVIEYVGEIIDEQEYQRRIHKMHEQKDENYYFLTIDKDRIIDAGPKGNLARFMNHCCQPNCETQKWTVNGDTRVGLFAMEDIPADAELTFNYNLECIGKEKKICKCGAPNCSGFIGVKAKVDESQKKPKKNNNSIKKKKQQLTPQVSKNDGPCFICGQQGDVGACNNKICTKFYHLQCVNLEFWPEGKWVCPWHNCSICSKRTIRCCVKCINSYCPVHSDGNVRYDKLLGFICSEHDPTKESQEISNQNPAAVKNSKPSRVSTTEETDVTSTTPDEIDSNPSNQTDKNIDDDIRTIESPELIFGESVTSTPTKNKEITQFVHSLEDCENCIITNRSEVSNADIPDEQAEEEKPRLRTRGKRKRGRPTRSAGNSPKKIKLSGHVSSEAVVKLKRNFTTSNLLDIPAQNEVKLSSSVPTRHLRITRSGGANTELKRFLSRQSELEKDLPIRKRSRPRCEATL